METTVFTLLAVILLGVLLCAIGILYKVLKKCIEWKEWLFAYICGVMLLIQCGVIIIVIKTFISHILN